MLDRAPKGGEGSGSEGLFSFCPADRRLNGERRERWRKDWRQESRRAT